MLNFKLSHFKNNTNVKPELSDLPWDEQVKKHFNRHVIRNKKNGSAISGAVFKAGTTRNNENVIELSTAILDIDHGDLEQVDSLLGKLGCETLVYSTHSNTATELRVRVVIPLKHPIPARDWKKLFAFFNDLFDGKIDPICVNVSQMYYLPSCPASCKEYAFFVQYAGDYFDWADYLKDWTETTDEVVAGHVKSRAGSSSSKDKVDVRLLAEEVVHKVYGGNLRFVDGCFQTYRNGYWPNLERRVGVEKPILHAYPTLSCAVVKQVIDNLAVLRAEISTASAYNQSSNLICFANGTLDMSTLELLPHDPEHNLVSQIDCQWNPKAKSRLWEKTLKEIFRDDQDQALRISFLQEFFGYSLTPDVSQQCFLWMVGSGANGKSLLLDVLTAIVGEKNVSNVKLEDLSKAFTRTTLQGKLVNVSNEMSASSTVADSFLKEIVSGERLHGEHKFGDHFYFWPTVKLVGATNVLPRLLDTTDGFFRRAIILDMTRKFKPEEMDRTLGNRLMGELQGVVTWAIHGLARLNKRGRFEQPPSAIATANSYRQESDHVLSFIKDECYESQVGTIPKDLYAAYRDYTTACGFKALNINTFGKRLAAAGIKKKASNGSDYWLLDPIHCRKGSVDELEQMMSLPA